MEPPKNFLNGPLLRFPFEVFVQTVKGSLGSEVVLSHICPE